MAWYGGTHGRPHRRRRTDEAPWEVALEGLTLQALPPCESGGQVWNVFWTEDGPWLVPLPAGLDDLDGSDGRVLTRCHPSGPHGGRRRWEFVCTGCGEPCRRLYAVVFGGELECRNCHRLVYRTSQQWWRWESTERAMLRLISMAELGRRRRSRR